MKKSLIVLAALLVCIAASAQKVKEKNVPAVVKEAFTKTYPTAEDVEWEKEGSNYETEFELGETDYSVLYDASGNVIETEVEIATDQLPEKVKDYITANYKNKKIKEAAKITNAGGTVTYEAEVDGKDLIFDAQGNFIKEIND